MLRKSIFISFFLLAVMTIAPLQGHCENWKDFFKDSGYTYQYDKDSIHYPKIKKIMGLTVRDKNIVNVWIRYKLKESEKYGNAILTQIYCVERECDGGCAGELLPDLYSNGPSGHKQHIEPGSPTESLHKTVCP